MDRPAIETIIQRAPIDALPDLCIHQQSIMEQPCDAYYAIANMLHDRIKLVQEIGDMSPEMSDEIVNLLAFRDRLLNPEILGTHARIKEEQQYKLAEHYDRALEPTGATMTDLEQLAKHKSLFEIYDYFMSKLESYTSFLATGKRPGNWPEASRQHGIDLLSWETPGVVISIAESLYASSTSFIDEFGGVDAVVNWQNRFQKWLQEHCGLLLSKRRIGLATPLINTVRRIDESQTLIDKLTLAMSEVRDSESEDEYRKLYGYVSSTLNSPFKNDFLRANRKLEAPLTFGATREIHRIGRTAVLLECFEEGELVHARLADGNGIILPYRYFRARGIYDYGEPSEREIHESQVSVGYDELEEAAKEALETAWQAHELESLREETLPYYQRLALKPDALNGDTLHTVMFRDGYHRIMSRYPDDHGFVTSDKEPQIDRAVVSAEQVSDSWLVIPYNGSYVNLQTFLDPEPNFFGPGEDKASAFWIAGNPRTVIDASHNPKYMCQSSWSESFDQPRWVILPIRYYWVDTEIHNP